MHRVSLLAVTIALATTMPAAAHEIRVGPAAATDPYAPYSFMVGDWDVTDASGGAPFVALRIHWAQHHAYLRYGGYIGQDAHFEGMMMWNGVHHKLDALIATDMDHGLVQELGTVSIVHGAAVRESVASYSEGVSAGGPLAGARGAITRTRQTMRPIDRDHISLSFQVKTPTGWRPLRPVAIIC